MKLHPILSASAVRPGIISTLSLTLLLGSFLSQTSRAADNGLAQTPLRGWSTWSALEGAFDENKIKAEADVEAAKLKSFGYVYINIDDGWQGGYDDNGLPVVNSSKFPSGIKALTDYIHSKGLKFGIYFRPGLDKDVYKRNSPILGTTYTVQQISDGKTPGSTSNGSWKIDFTKPGAVEYMQSLADRLASWGVDYVKLDFVGPGGGTGPADTRDEVKQWMIALKKTGRPIWLELSNSLSFENASFWRQNSNGWRIESDIESYKPTSLTNWRNVIDRFNDAPKWAPYAGPGAWNDLDSVEIGNGDKDGISVDERKSVMTLWCISCSPLIIGADLTALDNDDLALLTNPELLAVQAAGNVATPISQATPQQVWRAKNSDGSYTVALFALDKSAPMKVSWSDLGIQGPAYVHDLWTHQDLGKFDDSYSVTVPEHGVVLIRVSTNPPSATDSTSGSSQSTYALSGKTPVGTANAVITPYDPVLWGTTEWYKTPVATWGKQDHLTQEVYYAGDNWRGHPTRIFAYYGKPDGPGPFPAVVLIHGGGGRAFKDWAEHWAEHGYVALAMDLAGNTAYGPLPDSERGPAELDPEKIHDFAPSNASDMWMHYAVGCAIRGHSLLLSRPEVDPARTAVTGMSWGGYLTCITAGIDHRFKAAAPVYGCGFLADNSVWVDMNLFSKMSPEMQKQWSDAFDPSRFVGSITCPTLFLDGTTDFAYPPDSLQRTYSLVKTPVTLSMMIDRKHGPFWSFLEVDAFIDSVINNGVPLPQVSPLKQTSDNVSTTVLSKQPIAYANFDYTTDTGPWQKRVWKETPATLEGDTATAALPTERPLVCYLRVTDTRNLAVTTPLIELPATATVTAAP